MMQQTLSGVPDVFCWTRIGTEGGETLDSIIERKERERLTTGGLFLWGIGNAVGAAVLHLVRSTVHPQVLFSPTRSQPRPVDIAPDRRVVWTAATTLGGDRYRFPQGTRVMGGLPDGRRPPPRYALVCAADGELALSDYGRLHISELRNLVSGRPVGASQVTAVVRRATAGDGSRERPYLIAFRATLVAPYFVRLAEPVVIWSELSREQSREVPA